MSKYTKIFSELDVDRDLDDTLDGDVDKLNREIDRAKAVFCILKTLKPPKKPPTKAADLQKHKDETKVKLRAEVKAFRDKKHKDLDLHPILWDAVQKFLAEA